MTLADIFYIGGAILFSIVFACFIFVVLRYLDNLGEE